MYYIPVCLDLASFHFFDGHSFYHPDSLATALHPRAVIPLFNDHVFESSALASAGLL
jgi:hypothetical protein